MVSVFLAVGHRPQSSGRLLSAHSTGMTEFFQMNYSFIMYQSNEFRDIEGPWNLPCDDKVTSFKTKYDIFFNITYGMSESIVLIKAQLVKFVSCITLPVFRALCEFLLCQF